MQSINSNIKTSSKKGVNGCFSFVRNTYLMIDTCDRCHPSIAQWSEDGTSFVIKDIDELSINIMSKFFRHNNFKSFVRQLNFYGFRKIKKNQIRIDPSIEEKESNYWRFHHEYFVRGQPEMLPNICKARQASSVDNEELKGLGEEVKNMKDDLSGLSSDIQDLKSSICKMIDSFERRDNSKRYTRFEESQNDTHKKQRRHSKLRQSLVSPAEILSMFTSFDTAISIPCENQSDTISDNDDDEFEANLKELSPVHLDGLGLDDPSTIVKCWNDPMILSAASETSTQQIPTLSKGWQNTVFTLSKVNSQMMEFGRSKKGLELANTCQRGIVRKHVRRSRSHVSKAA